MKKNMTQLEAFFTPQSMAIIGASESLHSYGARYIQALTDIGFQGRLYAVNHSGDTVLGHKIYRSVLEIPDTIDLVALCTPARYTPDILRECLEKHVKAAIILSAGFSEHGDQGRLLEQEILKIADQGIRIMGPNCFGTYCPAGKITIVPGGHFPKKTGPISMIAQSGQLSEGITARSFGEGIRYAKVASYGNACNINEADLLDYLMADKDTHVFTSYLEGVRDGRRFFEIARQNAGRKPILIWKVGLTQMGAAAASSHTGSLAGSTAVWDAFFRQTRATQVGSMEELVDASIGFSCLPNGCGYRTALISGGGAGTVIGADACEAAGLQMPAFSRETEETLSELLPDTGTIIKNPLDIGNPHPPLSLLNAILEAVASSDQVDAIVIRRIFFSVKVALFFSGSTAPTVEEQQALLNIPVLIKQKYNKPVIIVLPEELTGLENLDFEAERREIRDFFFNYQIPVYTSEQRAFKALAHLANFKGSAGKAWVPPIAVHDDAPSNGRTLFTQIIQSASSPVLDEIQCKNILKAYDIDVTLPILAQTKAQTLEAARELGYPVAAKIVSPQITHKSDIGGVKLGLKNDDDVTAAFESIMAAVSEKAPDAVVEGISIQKMADPGIELVVGMTKDPQFGPMMMFGLGGTIVEVLKDVAFRIVPLTRTDAGEMIRQIKGYRLLQGYRGQPAVDIPYLEDLLLKISEMLLQNPEIKEMDINPLMAYTKGAVAVDARIILEEKES